MAGWEILLLINTYFSYILSHLGSLNFLKGEGPIFEFDSDDEITLENFSYSVTGLELDDGDLTLMEDFFFNNQKLEVYDNGSSWGSHRSVKIWKYWR